MLDPADKGRHVELRFDGIATHATVWVNNLVMKRNFCGYTGFTIDITSIAHFGDEPNHIAVRVDAVPQQGWWYEGAGIYRHVWLVKKGATHLVPDGVFAQPVQGADGGWTIPVEATLTNNAEKPSQATVTSVLEDLDGREVTRGQTTVTVPVLGQAVATFPMTVAKPRLWSIEEPNLYRVRTTVTANGEASDGVITPAGFRTLSTQSGPITFNIATVGQVSQLVSITDALHWHLQTECANPTSGFWSGYWATGSPAPEGVRKDAAVAYRHRTRANAAFYDGRVQAMAPVELWVDSLWMR